MVAIPSELRWPVTGLLNAAPATRPLGPGRFSDEPRATDAPAVGALSIKSRDTTGRADSTFSALSSMNMESNRPAKAKKRNRPDKR